MTDALLVTPLPPQPTGLADYARRILDLTREHVNWTVAYPDQAEPVEGFTCIPISELRSSHFQNVTVYQVGNSPHCSQVIDTLLQHRGIVLFHETNLHHVLRHMAHSEGDWKRYREHVSRQYGDLTDEFLKTMNRRTSNRTEYDMRLRVNPLTGMLADSAQAIAVLSDTARMKMEKTFPGRKIHRMGFLPDFIQRVEREPVDYQGFVIGIAGTFHYGRNWEAMSEAVVKLRRYHECRLVASGSGWPETDHPWIRVTGRLSDIQFRKEIEQFHIALDLRHNTCSETSGSMMDILRSGIPAVVSDQGSFRDIPGDAVLRIPIESGASGAFSAMKYLIENKDVMESIGRNAESYFSEVSDRETCLKQWLSLLKHGVTSEK